MCGLQCYFQTVVVSKPAAYKHPCNSRWRLVGSWTSPEFQKNDLLDFTEFMKLTEMKIWIAI